MKQTSTRPRVFTDRPWPEILAKIGSGDLAPAERRALKDKLAQDARFRERFCDWIKTLRTETTEKDT